jgi:signal peptidase
VTAGAAIGSARLDRTMKLHAFSLLVFAALVVGWLVLLRPVSLGGSASYATVSGKSMEPRLHTGDLVIAHAQSSYAVGEVVLFRIPAGQPGEGSLIVHRIIGGDATSGFIVQGDNKDAPDPWRPKGSDIIGRSWLELPGSGNALLTLRRPIVLASVLGGLAALLVLTSGSGAPSSEARTGRSRFGLGRRPARSSQEVGEG